MNIALRRAGTSADYFRKRCVVDNTFRRRGISAGILVASGMNVTTGLQELFVIIKAIILDA